MRLEDLKWQELSNAFDRLFLVPLGSMEQHGYHLPLATDALIVSEIARHVESHFTDRLVLMPTQWVGHSPHHQHFGCVSLMLRPYMDLITGICSSLATMGVRDIFLLNGHGGNDIPCKAALQEMKRDPLTQESRIIFASYWSLAASALASLRTSPPGGMGHACEMETSILLAIAPEQVDMARAKDDGPLSAKGFDALDMLHPQPYYGVRDFHEFSASGTLGMPSVASAEKGKQFVEAITDAVVHFIQEFFFSAASR